MEKINPFGCNFYLDSLEYPDRDNLLKKIAEQYDKNPNSKPDSWDENVHTSIQYGKHKDNFEYFELAGIPLDLVALINDKVKKLVEIENLQGLGEFYISEMWYNAYKNGQYQYMHKHSNNYNNFFSGVYYFELDEEHSSTRFYNPAFEVDFEQVLDHKLFTFSPKVNQNDIIIFPSDVGHDVTRQYSDKLRVTISFNVSCLFNEHFDYS